jgi:hypothetical protein
MSKLPKVECPNCKEDAVPTHLIFACKCCSNNFPINVALFPSDLEFSKDDVDEANRVARSSHKKIAALRKHKAKANSEEFVDDDGIQEHSSRFHGNALKLLKRVKKTYDFGTIDEAVRFVFSSYISMVDEMKHLSGKSVYLTDENGNRSEDLKKRIFKKHIDTFNQMQNAYFADQFLQQMSIAINAKDVEDKEARDEDDDPEN